jgi:ribosomal protein L37AE/L43A
MNRSGARAQGIRRIDTHSDRARGITTRILDAIDAQEAALTKTLYRPVREWGGDPSRVYKEPYERTEAHRRSMASRMRQRRKGTPGRVWREKTTQVATNRMLEPFQCEACGAFTQRRQSKSQRFCNMCSAKMKRSWATFEKEKASAPVTAC